MGNKKTVRFREVMDLAYEINNYYHSEVSKDCSLDPICSTIQAIRIIKSKGWSEWSCNKLI